MRYPRFAYIPQPAFVNQQDDERVFIIARRHFVDFIGYAIIIFALLLVPILIVAIGYQGIGQAIATGGAIAYDILILVSAVYFMLLMVVAMTSWVGYYYNLLIVTDERIIEVAQKGFFSREMYELAFEQIEDVSYHTKGFLNTFFEVGDIEIQTAGTARNFYVRRIPYPQIVFRIIHDLARQARSGVKDNERMPESEIIGLIGSQPVLRGTKTPAIMNFGAGLSAHRDEYSQNLKRPKTLREKFDRWWWAHMKGEQLIYVNYEFEAERARKLKEARRQGQVSSDVSKK